MKELYTTYTQKFQTAKALVEKYGLPTEHMDKAISDISDFKVTVPFIGGFSTGKSSLINTLLGRELLSTEITPETAVPTELSYGTDSVIYCTENGETYGAADELNTKTLSANQVRLAKVTLDNAFLKKIPTVKLVDMPGFDSGFEVHNRAIDDYLPNSLAYIVTVSAEEGTIRNSVLNFLNELKLSEMDVYFVITKSDKVMPDEVDELKEHIRDILENRQKLSNVKIAVTSAEDEEAEELEEMLLELQSRSDEIFQRTFSHKLCIQLADIRSYLIKRLSHKNTDAEQLQADKELLEAQIADLQRSVEEEKSHFAQQTSRCAEAVQQKVESDLRSNASAFENLLIQGGSIQEKVNYIVRNAITSEINRQLEPKIRRYAENVSALMQNGAFITDTNAPLLSQSVIEENEQMRTTLQNIVTPVSTIATSIVTGAIGSSIAATLGIASTVLGPIGAIVGVVAGAFLGNAINKNMRQKEENQKREAAAQRVREMIGEVVSSIGSKVEAAISEITAKVNEEIDRTVAEKIAIQRKALTDLEEKLQQTEQERSAEEMMLTADLQQIETMLKQEGVHSNA